MGRNPALRNMSGRINVTLAQVCQILILRCAMCDVRCAMCDGIKLAQATVASRVDRAPKKSGLCQWKKLKIDLIPRFLSL